MKKYISMILTGFFLSAFAVYFIVNKDQLMEILDISWLVIAVIMALKLLVVIFNAIFLIVVLVPLGRKIKLKESFSVTVLSTLGNFFTPFRGGAGIRAVYLKDRLKLPYSDFLSTVYGNFMIVFAVSSFIALIVLLQIHISRGVYSLILYLLFVGIIVGVFVSGIVNVSRKKKDGKKNGILGKISVILMRIQSGWSMILRETGLMVKLVALVIFTYIVSMFVVWLEFTSIGVTMNIFSLALYVALSTISLLVSITPASIGIRESVFLIFSSVMGITNEQVLQVALLDRGISFFFLVLLYLGSKVVDLSNLIGIDMKRE